jgi:hypothetical protein
MNVEPALHVERITEILRAEVLILVDTFLEEKFCWLHQVSVILKNQSKDFSPHFVSLAFMSRVWLMLRTVASSISLITAVTLLLMSFGTDEDIFLDLGSYVEPCKRIFPNSCLRSWCVFK